MVKRFLIIVAVVVGILALPALVSAGGGTFAATLSGSQEVPPVTTSASGNATVTISSDDTSLSYKVTYSGLSGALQAAHIHTGAAGTNGGIIFPLAAGPSPFSGTLTAADFKASGSVTTFAEALAAIRAGTTYVNLHTAANPGGEIRGQLAPLLGTTTEAPTAPGAGLTGVLVVAFALAAGTILMRRAVRARSS